MSHVVTANVTKKYYRQYLYMLKYKLVQKIVCTCFDRNIMFAKCYPLLSVYIWKHANRTSSCTIAWLPRSPDFPSNDFFVVVGDTLNLIFSHIGPRS